MKTLRMIMMGLMALVCVTGFVACGSDDDDPTPAPTPTDPTTPTEKPTSLTATYHFLISESMYKYTTLQLVDGSGNVVKDLAPADFKEYTEVGSNVANDDLKAILTTYFNKKSEGKKRNSAYYDYAWEQTYTTFPFSYSYKLKATVKAGSIPDSVTVSDVLMACNYVTYTGKGSFRLSSEHGTYSLTAGVKMDSESWAQVIKVFNGASAFNFSCDSEGNLSAN